jgi:hypothetical protein
MGGQTDCRRGDEGLDVVSGTDGRAAALSRGRNPGRWLEHSFQLPLGAAETTLHGSQGQIEHLGNLVIRSFFHIMQQEAAAVLRSEPSHGAFELRNVAEQVRVGAWCVTRQPRGPRPEIDPVGCNREGRAGGVGPLEPHVVERRVVRDLANPGRRLAFGAIAFEGAEHLHEGILCQVFRRLVVSHQPVDAVEHARPLAAHDFATRVFIALARQCHEFQVGYIGEIGGLAHTRDYGGLGRFGFRV